MSDIVERLRNATLYAGHGKLSELPEKAADEITRLRADVTDLTIEVKELAGEVDFQKDKVKSHGEQVARLRALNAELVEALTAIVEICRNRPVLAAQSLTVGSIARAAIAKTEKENSNG